MDMNINFDSSEYNKRKCILCDCELTEEDENTICLGCEEESDNTNNFEKIKSKNRKEEN